MNTHITENYKVYQGNCLDVMRSMADNSVDSIVTDPPYGLSFMGKKWDYDVPSVEIWAECLRVLKPGGHLLSFAGTRTQHRMAVRIEDAGFDIRDMIAWVYGSGFPKSLDVSKAIDKAAGAERIVLSEGKAVKRMIPGADQDKTGSWIKDNGREFVPTVTTAATDAAAQWQGWGTALKPALEPITVARKPLIGTVAANVLAHGTGGLNIDACRVAAEAGGRPLREVAALREDVQYNGNALAGRVDGSLASSKAVGSTDVGRWPANLIHDGSDEVLSAFPNASGQLANASTSTAPRKGQNVYGALRQGRGEEASANSANDGVVGFKMKPGARRLDNGSAARFFKQINKETEWQDQNQPQSSVSTAGQDSFLRELVACTAVGGAVTLQSLEEIQLSVLKEPSMAVTATELSLIAMSVTDLIQNIVPKFLQDPLLEKHTQSSNLVSAVMQKEPTGTMTITVSHWRLDGFADHAIFSITPRNLVAGEKDSGLSNGRRLYYCAKTSKKDRGDGNTHPTVKPTELMAYLCRLVTPPGGVVLDPFMGSGSTGKAAMREGFKFIGVEMEADYIDVAVTRIEDSLKLAA